MNTGRSSSLIEAIILAGGRGTRLQSLFSDIPKPMAPVNGRPFIEWLVRQLIQQGVRRIILSTGYRAEMLEQYLGNGSRFGAEIVYVRETTPLGTGGAVRAAFDQVRGNRAIVLNGDSYCRFDLAQLLQKHKETDAVATLWLTKVDNCDRYGAVCTAPTGAVTAFQEKQPGLEPGTISAGVYLVERSISASIPTDQPTSIEHAIFPALIGNGLFAVIGSSTFLDIGTPESYAVAETTLREDLSSLTTVTTPDMMLSYAQTHLRESASVHIHLANNAGQSIVTAVGLLTACFRNGGKLLLCGNGGSAADAQHLAAEFVSRLTQDFDRPALPAIALTTDTSFITAYANDLHFDGIFARQIEALGQPGDVLIGFSTSGSSRNVIRAFEQASRRRMTTVAFVGIGGHLAEIANCALIVPSHKTQYIQEATIALYHIICELVERELYG